MPTIIQSSGIFKVKRRHPGASEERTLQTEWVKWYRGPSEEGRFVGQQAYSQAKREFEAYLDDPETEGAGMVYLELLEATQEELDTKWA